MNYKIVASDLDKTLLNDDMSISPENWDAIKKLGELGVSFVPTTGRAYWEMPNELRDSELIRYCITSGGAKIYDRKEGKSYDLALEKAVVHEMLDKFYSYDVCVILHANDRSYVDISTHNPDGYRYFNMSQTWVDYLLDKDTPIENLKDFAYSRESIESICVFFKNKDEMDECKAHFDKDERLLTVKTSRWNIEICAKEAGKGNAILKLAELLGVSPEQTIAVGDGENDMTMVQQTGLGLAVSNANEMLKAVADEIICSNEQHAIKYILENYIER